MLYCLVHTFERGAASSTCHLRYLLVSIRRALTTIDPPINVVRLSSRSTRAIIRDGRPIHLVYVISLFFVRLDPGYAMQYSEQGGSSART
jgi:hypothetical protein